MPTTASGATLGSPASAASSAGNSGEALPVGTYLGEFELTSVLGEGGFGIVYLAWDHSLERKVALKEYMPSALATRQGGTEVHVKSDRHRDTFEAGRKSFVNEAKLLAQFDHPSLVKVYRFWEANGTAYMVMPFYEGVTLKDALKALGAPPDEAWLMALLAPLTEALAVIHSENCFHRDIAPDNVILLQGSGLPLLLDFGAARRVIGDMTQALTVILKPGYAPVEQYAEAPGMKQGPWTDIYALAASVYFALKGTTPPASVSRLMSDSYVPLAHSAAGQYSNRFLTAMDRALRVRPEERTASIAALRDDLGLTASGPAAAEVRVPSTPMAPSPSATGRAPAPRAAAEERAASTAGSRKPLILGGVAAIGLGGAAVVAYLLLTPAAQAPVAALPAATPAPSVTQTAAAAPPPPVEVAVTAPPPPTPFDAGAEFAKVLSAQTPGFTVQARSARPRLRIDRDNLAFTLTSNQDGYVTVLVLGPDGQLMRLIPSKEMPDTLVKAGQSLSLPPPNVLIRAGEPAGPEQFLAIVSSSPRDYSMLSTRVEGGYLSLPVGDQATAALAKRAPTGLPALLGSAQNCKTPGCDDFGAAQFSVDVVR
jgi:serine/threonine protein kinase